NSAGNGQGAIVLGTKLTTVADPSNPAHIGDIVVIYCTGLGPVSPTVDLGQPTPGASNTVNAVSVTIGGVPSAPIYAGLSPGSVGLYQVNVSVPAGVALGDNVLVKVSVSGKVSQDNVTMAVR